MKFINFKTATTLDEILNEDFFISSIITDEKGFRLILYNSKNENFLPEIVVDFEFNVEDYRVSNEGRRPDHSNMECSRWPIIEVQDSDYLKKLDKESDGILLFINPNLKHYIMGDQDYVVDIISKKKPLVYLNKYLNN